MADQYTKIPKGTTVYDNSSLGIGWVNPLTAPASKTTRDLVVKSTCYAFPTDEQKKARMPKLVMWSNGSKYCLESDVELNVPAPVRKAPATPKITLRQRLVKGSKWKLTAPAAVIKPGNPVTMASVRNNITWTEYSPVTDYELPIGTEIEVTGKTTASIHFSRPDYCSFGGVWVPIKVVGSKTPIIVEFKELNKNPEQIGEAVVEAQFVIWDTAEQKYYTGYEYAGWNSLSLIQYDAKLSKAKKFKRLADVRVHALIKSGYYDDLPESWGSVPEWMTGPKAFDIPDTWEIIKLNKLTKEEIERIELVQTFKRSWKLRTLTVKYNSAVRAVYSDLEKKGKLSEYSAMMMFGRQRDNKSYWVEELSEEEKSEVNALLARFAGDAKICKTNTGFAAAIKDAATATMILLSYGGNLRHVVIDFTTMDEVVNQK